RSRPRPASTFSLNTVHTARPSSRYSTMRTELEPMSMTATSRPSGTAGRARIAASACGAIIRQGSGQRFPTAAAPGETGIGHEIVVGGEGAVRIGRLDPMVVAGGIQHPAVGVVLEVGHHDLVQHLVVHGAVGHRAHDL